MPAFLFLAVLMIPMAAATLMYNRILGFIEMGVTAVVVFGEIPRGDLLAVADDGCHDFWYNISYQSLLYSKM